MIDTNRAKQTKFKKYYWPNTKKIEHIARFSLGGQDYCVIRDIISLQKNYDLPSIIAREMSVENEPEIVSGDCFICRYVDEAPYYLDLSKEDYRLIHSNVEECIHHYSDETTRKIHVLNVNSLVII